MNKKINRDRNKPLFFHNLSCGFTLSDFLIATAVIVIIAAIIIPSFYHYYRKFKYSTIIHATDRYKVAIAKCIKKRNGLLADCDGGRYGIPKSILKSNELGSIQSIVVKNAVITVTPKAHHGIRSTDTFVLTPTYKNKAVTWHKSGGGCESGLIEGC